MKQQHLLDCKNYCFQAVNLARALEMFFKLNIEGMWMQVLGYSTCHFCSHKMCVTICENLWLAGKK